VENTNGQTQKLVISKRIPTYSGAKCIFFTWMSDLRVSVVSLL